MIRVFRVVALLEGISLIVLVCIGVPLKYHWENDFIVKAFGMPHGILFLAYVFLVFVLKSEKSWSWQQTIITLIASLIPFGTFYIDSKYLRK